MNGPEIFSLVTKKRQRIEELVDPTTFVLNKEIEALQQDIAELQKECPHEYNKGVCKYCGKEEEK
jgi:hypothetical protein